MSAPRVLILSWEYPPVVEGGLARHVRKLSEQLVRDGVEAHVLTRGGGRLAAGENRYGVIVHRVREPDFPRDDIDAFIAWVGRMNDDMRAAGHELGGGFDVVHSHDWLVAAAARGLARSWRLPWLVTVHANEYGRHEGRVGQHPQSHILREVVPRGQGVGLRFRARDAASLARMAEKLLGDEALRERLVAQAREHVLAFDWADVARQTQALYEELRGARV